MKKIVISFILCLLVSCASKDFDKKGLDGNGIISGVVRQTNEKAFFEYNYKNEIVGSIDGDQEYRGFAIIENATIYTLGLVFDPEPDNLIDVIHPSPYDKSNITWQGTATLYGIKNNNVMMCNLSLKKEYMLAEGGLGVCQTLDGKVLDIVINRMFN